MSPHPAAHRETKRDFAYFAFGVGSTFGTFAYNTVILALTFSLLVS